MHTKPALTFTGIAFNFANVDGRKGWLKLNLSQSEVGRVIRRKGQPGRRPNPKKPTALRGAVGVRDCESSDHIKGRDGACVHAVKLPRRSWRLEHNQCHGLFHFLRNSRQLFSRLHSCLNSKPVSSFQFPVLRFFLARLLWLAWLKPCAPNAVSPEAVQPA